MSTRSVKVRFCPSPTGVPHVGLIRTALYNWAYAKHNEGSFLFRIEDTDAERDSEDSFQAIIEGMTWLGLTPDEGVGVGGTLGPYRQSERSHIYSEIIEKLLSSGYLYESYSTKEEIDARNAAVGRSLELGYDNYDRDLSAEAKLAYRAEGRLPVLRVKVPAEESFSFVDLVRGEITFPPNSFSDFVVVRKDGKPLYTFVNPVDDALMGVTHVLRGEDLLSSTPRQLVLYRALIAIGITDYVPEFGHMPYILGNGNKKLSKRDPEANLFNYRDAGFIKEGLLNYLALLGWSIANDRDVFTLDEMAAHFDIHNVNPSPARFDEKKAAAINGEHIRLLSDEDLLERLLPFLSAHGELFQSSTPTSAEMTVVTKLIPALKTRMRLLSDAVDYLKPVIETHSFEKVQRDFNDNEKSNLLFARRVIDSISSNDFTIEKLTESFSEALAAQEEITNKTLWLPLRWALTARKNSLPLYELMDALGKDEVIRRLELID